MLNHLRHLAVGTDQGALLFRPQGPDQEWEIVGYGLYGQKVNSIAIDAQGKVAAAVEKGQVKQTSDWTTWQTLYKGLHHSNVSALAQDPKNDCFLAGTTPAAVFRSTSGEEHWLALGRTSRLSFQNEWSHPDPPHSPRVIKLLVHPHKENCIVAGIQSGGIIVSHNDGQTWRNNKAGLSRQLNDLRHHPDQPDRLYACNLLGFYRSDDLGLNWRQSNSGLCYEQADTMCVHSLDPERLLLSVSHPTEGHSVLFKSDTGGNRWEVACSELPFQEGLKVTTLESGGGVYFAGTEEGFLLGSRDRSRWEVVRANLPPIRCLAWVGHFRP